MFTNDWVNETRRNRITKEETFPTPRSLTHRPVGDGTQPRPSPVTQQYPRRDEERLRTDHGFGVLIQTRVDTILWNGKENESTPFHP